MAAHAKITVLPGSPDVPESVEILCSGLDRSKSVELLVDDVVVKTIRVADDGSVSDSYAPSEDRKVRLANLQTTEADVTEAKSRALIQVSDESHSMGLRYDS